MSSTAMQLLCLPFYYNINDGEFSKSELQAVKKQLKEGKQSGPGNISPAVIKRCDLDDIVLNFANRLINDELKPDQWSMIDLIPIPKSGDLSNVSNYRGISLSSVVAKVVNKMILNRLLDKIDINLRPNQNGFRPGKSTIAHILALRRLIEEVKSHSRKAIIIFVDFKKAFDSVNRREMLRILKAYDIPSRLLMAIEKLYENTQARVITPDGETTFFKVLAGVLQGDTLAPYIFAIVLDYVMRKTYNGREADLGFQLVKQRSRRHPAITVTDLDFADDIALLTEEIHQAQEVLLRLEEEAQKVGLFCNEKKTELQVFNHETPVEITTKSGKLLKVVDNFKYLGSWTQSTSKDFEIRKALAWNVCHKMRKIWKSSLKRKMKLHLFISTVECVLLYGAETWTLTSALTKQLDGCYTRMLRMALDIPWQSHTTNVELYGDLPKVSDKVRQQRMRISGHCVRHKEEIASQLVLWQPTGHRRKRGRRAMTYIDVLMDDTGMENVSELKTVMLDRDGWKSRVLNVGRPGGRPK